MCFFACYGAHRDLHSFPTRRSSDLPALGVGLLVAFAGVVLIATSTSGAGNRDPFGVRSEEHTSELQSQFQLVCRLLLEKKKNRRSGSVSSPTTPRGCRPTRCRGTRC